MVGAQALRPLALDERRARLYPVRPSLQGFPGDLQRALKMHQVQGDLQDRLHGTAISARILILS